MKLQLGFEDTPYAVRYSAASPILPSIRRRMARKISPAQVAYGQSKTTGQVATELENKYHIVETFYSFEENTIVDNYEQVYANGLELGMGGGSFGVAWDPSQVLEGKFRRALSGRKFDGVIRGVPTQASLRGVSHLYRNPFAQRAPRPSFIDTSLYQRSFRAWTEV